MRLLDGGAAGKDVVKVLEIFAEEGGDVEGVGAACFAEATVDAVVDFVHFGNSSGSEDGLGWAAADELNHAGAGVDFDADGAGHAIATAATELAGEVKAVLLN